MPPPTSRPRVGAGTRAPVERLLCRFDGVIDRGDDRWYARCPSHDDKTPSLSIRATYERVLIHCFGGCKPSAVLSALGLKWSDLYADRWTAAREAAYAQRHHQVRIDPSDVDRWVLRIAAADIRAGKVLSVEDRARVEVARLRLGGRA
jgi:hypothetical protein